MVTPGTVQQLTAENISRADLPLAIYREVAAHLQQVTGITVSLEPQRSPEFRYQLSQIGAMVVQYPENFPAGDRRKLEQILAFYAEKYGDWQREALK